LVGTLPPGYGNRKDIAMSKKLYAVFVPLFAVAAFALVPATSQAAEFHWYSCLRHAGTGEKFSDSECQNHLSTGAWEWERLPFTSAKTQIITFGKLTLTTSNGLVFVCKVLDAGNIWNVTEATPGKDNIEVFVTYECKSEPESACAPGGLTITSNTTPPWETVLAAGPVDKIKGIKFTLDCNGTEVPFEGELTPKIVNSTATEPTFAEFTAASGTLTSPSGLTLTVSGKDRVLGFEHGEDIKVSAP
jgi:hypothetical protein